MKKINVLWLILGSIFLILFNVFFFVLGGTDHNHSVWISYGFIHLAYLLLLLTPKLIRSGESRAVFGFALYAISAVYFIVQSIIGIIFILLAPENHNPVLLIQLGLAGLYAIILVTNMIANERTADAEQERQYEIAYVKRATERIYLLQGSVDDREAKKKVERVYDTLNSSPVKSHPNLAQIEGRILALIDELEEAIFAKDKERIILRAEELLLAARERNSRLKSFH